MSTDNTSKGPSELNCSDGNSKCRTERVMVPFFDIDCPVGANVMEKRNKNRKTSKSQRGGIKGPNNNQEFSKFNDQETILTTHGVHNENQLNQVIEVSKYSNSGSGRSFTPNNMSSDPLYLNEKRRARHNSRLMPKPARENDGTVNDARPQRVYDGPKTRMYNRFSNKSKNIDYNEKGIEPKVGGVPTEGAARNRRSNELKFILKKMGILTIGPDTKNNEKCMEENLVNKVERHYVFPKYMSSPDPSNIPIPGPL